MSAKSTAQTTLEMRVKGLNEEELYDFQKLIREETAMNQTLWQAMQLHTEQVKHFSRRREQLLSGVEKRMGAEYRKGWMIDMTTGEFYRDPESYRGPDVPIVSDKQ